MKKNLKNSKHHNSKLDTKSKLKDEMNNIGNHITNFQEKQR